VHVLKGMPDQQLSTIYRSAAILSDAAGTSEVYGICFPAKNDTATIWSLDTNRDPIFKTVIETGTQIAFGRTCKSKDECVSYQKLSMISI
jgi:hypothetical protein